MSEYRMLGALRVLSSFSFPSAFEKVDLLDRLGSKLVYQPTILTDFAFAYCLFFLLIRCILSLSHAFFKNNIELIVR